jgi:spore coat polysaccharide biosynthesis protein SpsF
VILAILQARVNSTRLPGKVLAPVLGEPMIVRQLERVKRSAMIDALVVATSTAPTDDALVIELEARGQVVHRGPLDDVVARFDEITKKFAPDTIVRLTADCPLCDVNIIDDVIRSHLQGASDYTSNTLEPSYPDGLDVEVVSAAAWERLSKLPLSTREREHVTLGIYSRPDAFALQSVTQSPDRSGLRWTVDVPDDLDFVRAVYANLYADQPEFGQREILELLAAHPELSRTEADLARNAGLSISTEGKDRQ